MHFVKITDSAYVISFNEVHEIEKKKKQTQPNQWFQVLDDTLNEWKFFN